MILSPIPHKEEVTEIHIPLTDNPFHQEDMIMIRIILDLPVVIDMMTRDKVNMIDFRIEITGLETIVLATIDSKKIIISPIAQEMVSPTDRMIALNMDLEITVQIQVHSLDLLDLLPLISVGANLTVSHSCTGRKTLTASQKNKE